MILAIVGGKGGVGKSTIAFNLGATLDAVVVDADLGMADLPTGRGPDLHDVLAGRADPLGAVRESGVRLLPCGRSLAGARAADLTALEDCLRAVATEYGRAIVDCPAGMRADAGVPLAVADACVVVVSPREFALADAIRTRELARELRADLVAVVVNRTVERPPLATIERTLGAPATCVPADPRVRDSIAEGPVVDTAPASDAASAVEDLAAAVRACDRSRDPRS